MRPVGPPLTKAQAAATAAFIKYRARRMLRAKGMEAAAAYTIGRQPRSRGPLRVWCTRSGLNWCLDLTDVAQRLLYAMGAYEAVLIRYIIDQLPRDAVMLDIGAHVGLLSVPIARHLDELGGTGHVFSFEPSPDSASYLQANLDANNLAARVTLVRAAAGASEGTVELHTTPGYGDSSSTRSIGGSGPVVAVAPRIRIDDWWHEQGEPEVDLVKIDVEGYERDVLAGMRDFLKSGAARMFVIEVKPELTSLFDTTASRDPIETLAESGYELQPPVSTLVGLSRPAPHIDDNLVFKRRVSR